MSSTRLSVGIATIVASIALTAAPPAAAAELEPIGTFAMPVFVTSDPVDSDRLFVVEKAGRIKLIDGEGGPVSTFLDISAMVVSTGEQGLLSIAFATDYPQSGRFYAFFTASSDGDLHIVEFTAAGDSVDPNTLRPILTVPHPGRGNHNGGQLQIGPDGFLYIATGDGGGPGDADQNAQNLDRLLGKILRIDPEPAGGQPYTVPADNPFVDRPGRDEIWSYGLRNPWRFSFDRLSGALTIGDVGQGSWEEVNFRPGPGGGRGENFGWSCREGFEPYVDATPDPACEEAPDFTDPIHAYANSGDNCSITGGYVSRDPGVPELEGRYVYADFCAGQLRSLIPGQPLADDDRAEGLVVAQPSSFGEDACGRIYVASLAGSVDRFIGAAPTDCPPPPPPPDPDPDPDPPPPGPPPPPPGDGDARTCVGPRLLGTAGKDRLIGGPGRDRIAGRRGRDWIAGRGGEDCLRGGRGRDRIFGGRGADRIWGGRGRDRIRGGPGDDVIFARDGRRDTIRCGAGKDVVVADRKDRVRGCERLRLPR
jgi:glucose/arabinose dehydrogenase